MADETTNTIEDLEDEFDLDNLDVEDESEIEDMQAETTSGRSFWLVTLGIAALILIVVAGLIYYSGVWKTASLPPINEFIARATHTQLVQIEVTLPAEMEITQVQEAVGAGASETRVYESTPVQIGITPSMEKPASQDDPRTATVAALLTEAAEAQTQTVSTPGATSTPSTQIPTVAVTPATPVLTVVVTPAPTALPDTGWADEVGVPFMLGIALALIVAIILVRLVRASRAV